VAAATFAEVVRRRRMTRAFDGRAVPDELLTEIVDLASRAPSAGKSQGWHLVVLEGDETATFWDTTLPTLGRGAFRWKHLLDAPLIAIPLADHKAYTDRYSEPDKRATGLGAGPEAWPVPYWTIDASMSVMTMLLAAEAAGLGALFFGVFRGERELRRALGIPPWMEILGAVALGWPLADAPAAPPRPSAPPADDTLPGGAGRSAGRTRRSPQAIVHRSHW